MWLHSKTLDSCHLLLHITARVSTLLQKRMEREVGNRYRQPSSMMYSPSKAVGVQTAVQAMPKGNINLKSLEQHWGACHGHSCGHMPAPVWVPGAEVAQRKEPEPCRVAACGSMSWFPAGFPSCKTHLCLALFAFSSVHQADCVALHICRGKLNKFLELRVLSSKTWSMLISS